MTTQQTDTVLLEEGKMTVRLTALQQGTLAKIAAGDVWNVKFGYGAWRIQGAHPSVVGRLISMKLAHWGPTGGEDRQPCLLTEAGIAALPTPESEK